MYGAKTVPQGDITTFYWHFIVYSLKDNSFFIHSFIAATTQLYNQILLEISHT
jgi:hypothetical protein